MNNIHNDIPEMIDSPIVMVEANSRINIYEGEFTLKNDLESVTFLGEIYFDWFPNTGSKFSGLSNIKDAFEFGEKLNYNLIIDGVDCGECYVTNIDPQNMGSGTIVSGIFRGKTIIGDKSIGVEKIKFAIPNLRVFMGSPVKKINTNKITVSKNRLRLENDDYLILIDKAHNYKELKKSLDLKGGYIIQYGGELIGKKGSILFNDVKDTFDCLNTFLCFLNGRRTAAIFLQGISQNKTEWCDYSDYIVDIYKSVPSWLSKVSINELNDVWKRFYSIWKDDKDFLETAIHWYVEANGNSGFIEGSIVMAQTALELIYNWLLIEEKKILIGKDSENISASNKIRLLLSYIDVNYNVPPSFSNLKEFIDNDKDIMDAPEAIVQIRNAIVHSQLKKRKKLGIISLKAKYEALQLCLSYIELSLLNILDFNGKYSDRCSVYFYSRATEKNVPWQTSNKS